MITLSSLEYIFSQFHVLSDENLEFEKDGKSGLSSVYIVNKKYVLRWRALHEKTYNDFSDERGLLSMVFPLLRPICMPDFIKTISGESSFAYRNTLWTMTYFIPGEILCWIDEVSVLNEKNKKTYIQWLHEIQLKTQNLKKHTSHYLFVPWVEERFGTIKTYFSTQEQSFIRDLLFDVSDVPEHETCFVHGDYHPGNIILSGGGKGTIVGLIDLDWCHVGSIYEDLSLIILSFLRDISQEHFIFDEDIIQEVVSFYPWKVDLQKLKKYILLRSVHDISFITWRSEPWANKMETILMDIFKSLYHDLTHNIHYVNNDL